MTYIPGGSEPRQEPLGQPAFPFNVNIAGQPVPVTPYRKKRRRLLVGIIAAAAIVSIGVTLIVLTFIGVAPWSAKQQAIQACENSITNQLRSPATAKYVNVRASRSPADGWDVFGQVDSQNGFGAMVRTSWSCFAGSDGKTRTQVG